MRKSVLGVLQQREFIVWLLILILYLLLLVAFLDSVEVKEQERI